MAEPDAPDPKSRRRRRALTPEARIRRALRELGRAADEMARARDAEVPPGLTLPAPIDGADGAGWSARARAFAEALTHTLIARPHAVTWADGAMYCFQCTAVDCAHARPPGPQHTFAGYVPTGKPTWIPFLELCLQRRPPGFDRLFAERPGVVAFAESAAELTEGLLPGFGGEEGQTGYTVLGQVAVGLLPAHMAPDASERVVLTVQMVETRYRGAEQRLRLNLLGLDQQDIVRAAADGAPRNPAEQLRRTLHRARQKLESVGRRLANEEAQGRDPDVVGLVAPLVGRLRGDVSRIFNPDLRRTRHAETRHRGARRPTSTVWDDVRAASDDKLYADTRRGTLIALGPRGRAHVFTEAGRHVTSLRLEDGELARKLARQRWVPLSPERIGPFRAAIGDAASTGGEP